MNKKICTMLIVLSLFGPFVLAQDDPDTDDILAPLDKIVELLQIAASTVGLLVLTGAGIYYMISGSNIQARENAKSVATYAVMGLVLVWSAPLIVGYLTAPAV